MLGNYSEGRAKERTREPRAVVLRQVSEGYGVDHLLTEVDRQLGEQRAQSDAFATRSGLLTAATALLTGLLAGPLQPASDVPSWVLWIVGGASVIGVVVLCMSRLILGPSPSLLARGPTLLTASDL